MRNRRQEERGADGITVGLAVVAIAAIASVFGSTFLRRLFHRLAQRHREPELSETPGDALLAAGYATQDTVRAAVEGYRVASHGETVVFNMFAGFLGAFSLARLSTYGMRGGWWPLGTVRIGGRHIHHFVPGILIAFGSGAAALIAEDDRLERILAIPYGVGLGLTFDEAALLLDLRDVYWSREGLISVQASLGLVIVFAATINALRLLNRGEQG